jgi:integrase
MGVNMKPEKPDKPYPAFPLYAHRSGKWAKKVQGKTVYFGTWDNPEAALAEYEQFLDKAPAKSYGPLTVKTACNLFLGAKDAQVKRGDLSERSFKDYHRTCKRMAQAWGHRPIESLLPIHFQTYQATISESWNLVSVGNEITRIKTFLKWLTENGYTKQIRTGPDFRKPSRKAVRKYTRGQGKKMYSADQIRTLLDWSGVHVRAMILLGINCGYQNADIENLPLSVAQKAVTTGWIDYPRDKTEVDRRCPLWNRTRTTLAASLARRPQSSTGKAFVRHDGRAYCAANCEVAKTFRSVRDLAGVSSGGFSWLRKTFETVAGACGDQVAVDYIMGHVDHSMASVYRQEIQDERLRKASRTVLKWLASRQASVPADNPTGEHN